MAILPPPGVRLCGGTEERVRRELLDDGHVDTDIGPLAAHAGLVEMDAAVRSAAGRLGLKPGLV